MQQDVFLTSDPNLVPQNDCAFSAQPRKIIWEHEDSKFSNKHGCVYTTAYTYITTQNTAQHSGIGSNDFIYHHFEIRA